MCVCVGGGGGGIFPVAPSNFTQSQFWSLLVNAAPRDGKNYGRYIPIH